MRKTYFDWESVFAHIWRHCDPDGIWNGSGETLAEKFGVSEDEARTMLDQLCDRGLLERVYEATYAITKWHEPHDSGLGNCGGMRSLRCPIKDGLNTVG
jgi:hypothetical protein